MNRPDDLSRCLFSLSQTVETPNEIIVSDDSPDPNANSMLIKQYPLVIYQQGPHRGLGANRNACIRQATGTHIIFVDDDVTVPPNFFAIAHKLIEQSDPDTIITGYELNHGGGGRWIGETKKVIPKYPDFWGIQRLPTKDNDFRSFVINSTIFPRSLFDLALFDENLRYGSDEIDMARHAISLGYLIKYDDNLYVNHYPSLVNRESYKRYVHASRLYVTLKAYYKYEKSFIKATTYFFLAPVQLVLHNIKKRNWSSVKAALQAIILALNYLVTPSKPKLK